MKNHLPETYTDYSFYHYAEELGFIPATLLLLIPPLILFSLVYLMLRRKHKLLFWGLLGGYLLYNVVYIAMRYITFSKPYLGAVLVFMPVFIYWFITRLKTKAEG